MKKFKDEFVKFINRGNVIDMAVGVIIGAAFKAIVDSLVNDILSPIIGLVAGNSLTNLSVTCLGVELKYGSFITAVINFFLMALVLFFIVKAFNAFRKEPEKKPDNTKVCPYCKSKIDIDATRCPHCTSQLED